MKNYFEKLGHNSSLKERAYQNIKKQIIRGNIKPETRLLEEGIAKAMNISRAPIREAFNKLEKEGFVEIIPRKGTIVSKITSKEVEDIFEIRENLELLAIKKSLKSLPLEHLNQLVQKFEQFNFKTTEKSNRLQYLSLDKEFHDLLTKRCDNQMLIRLLSSIQEKVHWLRSFSLDRNSFNQSIEEHLAIVSAIQKKNEKLVKSNLV